MQKIRYGLLVMTMLLSLVTAAAADVSVSIGLPTVSIGINLPVFPELVPVPGYPVYYAPQMDANYFFYDGMYWVYQDDNWYASSWYNGPWGIVGPEVVPLYILRVPVSFYRQPPMYFRGWQANAPPRWGQHWGRGWERQHSGWNRWNRGSAPAPAPLPVYQRQYSGDRYPRAEQQHALHNQQYRYQPREKVVRQHFKQQERNAAPAPQQHNRQQEPAARGSKQPDNQHAVPRQQGTHPDPRMQPPQRGGEQIQKSAPVQAAPQQRAPVMREQKQQRGPDVREQKQQQGPARHEQQAPRAQGPGQGQGQKAQEPRHGQGQGQGQNKDEGRGHDK